CTQRAIDTTILSPTGFEFIPQPIVPPALSVGGLLRFFKSWRETKELVRSVLRDRKPAAVLGLGGYAAGVAVKTAAMKSLPTAIEHADDHRRQPGRGQRQRSRARDGRFAEASGLADPAFIRQRSRGESAGGLSRAIDSRRRCRFHARDVGCLGGERSRHRAIR